MELRDAVEAREAALREVAKLLSLPSHLENIASVRADYLLRQQVVLGNKSRVGLLSFCVLVFIRCFRSAKSGPLHKLLHLQSSQYFT